MAPSCRFLMRKIRIPSVKINEYILSIFILNEEKEGREERERKQRDGEKEEKREKEKEWKARREITGNSSISTTLNSPRMA